MGSVLMIVIIIQGSKRVKTCWLNYIIGTVLINSTIKSTVTPITALSLVGSVLINYKLL